MAEKLISKNTDEDLVYVLASRLRCNGEQSKEILQKVLDAMLYCIVENETLHVRRFGLFFLKKRKPSRLKNFENKTTMLDSFYMIRFKPSISLKDKVNKRMKSKEAQLKTL